MSAGRLISSEVIDTSIRGARAWRVRYESKDLANRVHEVSGLVIAPLGDGHDRPILTWAHGTTGLGDAACPSAQPDPARELITYFDPRSTSSIDYGVPGLQRYLDEGYIVCATDYQGLGTPGMHQYTVNITNARDALFIAHAARELVAAAGMKLVCAGWSQGGGTAAAIAELEDADFGDLQLFGTALLSPAVPSLALDHPIGPMAGAVTANVAPDGHLIMLIAGFATACDELKLTDLLSPLGEQIVQTAWEQQPVHHLSDTIAREYNLRGAILQPNHEKLEAWRTAITKGSAAQRRPRCPVLLAVDAFKDGTVVPVVWQDDYQKAVTSFGAQVTRKDYPNDDHFSLPASCADDVATWFASLLH